jgi:DNA uptake protein ComE-like DNA-binding protein
MKKLKSYFWYTKNQRNGILFLLAVISIVQLLYNFVNFDKDGVVAFNQATIISFQDQIDRLKFIEIENRKPKIYPFNPNYITDYKGYQLGMKTKEIDRLLTYRKQRLFVNSAKEFQKITKVSDSLLQKISPYFKFPDWVLKKRSSNLKQLPFNSHTKKRISEITTTDINVATQNDFLSIKGVYENLSERIIKYRTKLQGFSMPDQLFEVWGLEEEVGNQILQVLSVLQTPEIQKININTASFKKVLSNPYIDYDLCSKIFDYRDEVAELQSISELKNIEGFPLKKYTRIVLYLHAE